MSTATQRRSYSLDATQILKDAGAITASAAAQVGGAAKVLDTQGGNSSTVAAVYRGILLIDISAIDVSSNDEIYDIIVQGSDSATFASGIENLAQLNLGAAATRDGGAGVSLVGRYELPFINEQAGLAYRYLRAYTKAAGTTPSINYVATVVHDALHA